MAYGYDTRSWRNSTEHRQMQQECAAETARYLASPRAVIDVYPQCHCDAAPYPHDPEFWHGQKWQSLDQKSPCGDGASPRPGSTTPPRLVVSAIA
jgi:hypothetical protein